MRKKEIDNGWPIVAICYDFDKTLSPKDMQEYTLFPKLGISAHDFWTESNDFAAKNEMDRMLSYMKLIVKIAREKEDTLSLTMKDFPKMGKGVELFEGLDTWFDRISRYAETLKLNVEHYIISAGLKEIIEGTSIAKNFKAIYASCFVYNKSGVPLWPKQVINCTQKTQYLFRINKDCLDLSDEESLNKSLPDFKRRVSFRNFIYIGDSITDIPAMKVVKKEKGLAIGVYNPKIQNPAGVCKLFDEERIDFFAPADYREGSALESYVKKGIEQIKANEELSNINSQQDTLTGYLAHVKGITKYFCESIDEAEISELNRLKKETEKFFRAAKKTIEQNYIGDCFVSSDVILIIDEMQKTLEGNIKKRKTELKINSKVKDEPDDKK